MGSVSPTNLLAVGLDDVVVLHVEVVRGLVGLDADTVVEEAERVHLLALALGEGLHEPSERRGALDLEEDLGRAVGDLQVQVCLGLDVGLDVWLDFGGRVSVLGVGHGRGVVLWCGTATVFPLPSCIPPE